MTKIKEFTSDDFKLAVEKYSGVEVEEIEVIEDPSNFFVSAIKAKMEDGRTLQFIFDRSIISAMNWHDEEDIDLAEELEEAEFTQWPPTTN